MRVIAVQADLVWQNPEANRAQFEATLEREWAKAPADLVVLPEMFTTGFSMDLTHVDALNEAVLSTTSRWMLDLARKHDAAIVGSVGVRDVEYQRIRGESRKILQRRDGGDAVLGKGLRGECGD